jgi:hypothetical protein
LSIGVLAKAVVACVVLLIALPIACILSINRMIVLDQTVRYDRNNVDYQYVASVARAQSDVRKLDLKRINGGDWQFICIIGGYNDPAKILREQADKRRIVVSSIEEVEASFFGLSPVEESEGAISFVDGVGRGRTLLVDGFELLAGQHGLKCFGPETREISLPIMVIDHN